MTTHTLSIPADPDRLVETLRHEAAAMLNGGGCELVLDFSSVLKIDVAAARSMEELADRADQSSTRIALRAVNVGLYRALKLLKLAQRFSYLS